MKIANKLLPVIFFTSLATTPVMAEKDAGLGHDYRTFHATGKIDYGNISDSYRADLVMYLAFLSVILLLVVRISFKTIDLLFSHVLSIQLLSEIDCISQRG